MNELTAAITDDSFWHPLPPDALIRHQGIAPYTFPPKHEAEDEESVEEFLAAIFQQDE